MEIQNIIIHVHVRNFWMIYLLAQISNQALDRDNSTHSTCLLYRHRAVLGLHQLQRRETNFSGGPVAPGWWGCFVDLLVHSGDISSTPISHMTYPCHLRSCGPPRENMHKIELSLIKSGTHFGYFAIFKQCSAKPGGSGGGGGGCSPSNST